MMRWDGKNFNKTGSGLEVLFQNLHGGTEETIKFQPGLWCPSRDSKQTHPEHYWRVLPLRRSVKSELCRTKAKVMWCNTEFPRQLSVYVPIHSKLNQNLFRLQDEILGQADRWKGTAEETNSRGCCKVPTLQYDRGITGTLTGMEPRGGEGAANVSSTSASKTK